MNTRNDKYRTKISAACQPHVTEPIVAVGFFQPHGTVGAAAMSLVVSSLVGTPILLDAQNEADLPDLGLYALTDSALHVMEGKPKGFNWKVKFYLGYWPLSAFEARPVAGKVTDQVELVLHDGTAIRLESIRMGSQGFNEDIITRLIAGSASRADAG